jgi:hypothetical protein
VSIKYRVAEQAPNPNWAKYGLMNLTDAMDQVRKLAGTRPNQGDGYRFRDYDPHDPYGRLRDLDEVMRVLRKQASHSDVGLVGSVKSVKSHRAWLVRKVHVKARVINTFGNDDIDKIHTYIWREYGNADPESWGVYNRRLIAGSSSWSQHAYCPPNAEDVHFDSSNVMGECAHDIARKAGNGELPCGVILWAEHSLLSGSIVADHWDHFHYEGRTERQGTPPSHCP